MAELRKIELLSRKGGCGRGRRIAVLALALLSFAAPGAPADEDPVFFKDPDALTRIAIGDALELLKKPGIDDHRRGRETLEEIGYWAVLPVVRLLREGAVSERRNAALVLGTIGDRRSLPYLLQTAEDDSHLFVPGFAALMLGKFGRPEVFPRLKALIDDRKKSNRRIASVLSITKLRSPGSFEVLEGLVRSRDLSIVQEAAAFCLGFFRDQALVRGRDGRWEPCLALKEALLSSRVGLQRSALLAVALLGHRDLKNIYLRYAQPREDQALRRVALLALGRFQDADVTRLLLDTLRNPQASEGVKLMAAMLMKDRRDRSILDELLKISPEDQQVKAVLTLALSNFEELPVVQRICIRLTDKSNMVRAAAAIGLSRLADPDLKALAIRAITEMLQAGGMSSGLKEVMEIAREILSTGKSSRPFSYLGNEQFAADLPKDVEERVLDFVNHEVDRVLGITALTEQKAGGRREGARPVNDETSDLRDLEIYLERYPYFEPFDIPEPKLEITPRVDGPVNPGGQDPGGGKPDGERPDPDEERK